MTTDPRIAALAEAIQCEVTRLAAELRDGRMIQGVQMGGNAAIRALAALPPDWCGRSESVWNGQFGEIARLRKIEEAARAFSGAAHHPECPAANWKPESRTLAICVCGYEALRAALEEKP